MRGVNDSTSRGSWAGPWLAEEGSVVERDEGSSSAPRAQARRLPLLRQESKEEPLLTLASSSTVLTKKLSRFEGSVLWGTLEGRVQVK